MRTSVRGPAAPGTCKPGQRVWEVSCDGPGGRCVRPVILEGSPSGWGTRLMASENHNTITGEGRGHWGRGQSSERGDTQERKN